MNLFEKVLNNDTYLDTVRKIENRKFITAGKWDWEHGLGHYKRVAQYVNKILTQLHATQRTIELGITAALLHDLGLSKGDKEGHALESEKICMNYIEEKDITKEEEQVLKQAIIDHSSGNNIQSLVGLSLVLADKLDMTYHRTVNSSIQDKMNKEIQKIKKVDIEITDETLIVQYITEENFDENILKGWIKCITIPKKVAEYLNREYKFFINSKEINIDEFLNKKEQSRKTIEDYTSKKLQQILDDVRLSSLLYCTKNGKVTSSLAEEYLNTMNEYAKYCIPDIRDEWKETIRKLVYSAPVPKPEAKDDSECKRYMMMADSVIIDDLYDFLSACKIMERYHHTKSWEEVDELIYSQGHSGNSFGGLCNVMILYALCGTDFIERYALARIERDKEFKRYYDQAKAYQTSRKEAMKRLTYTLSKKQ